MKDAYSFDIDPAGLDQSFEDQREAYKRIFSRCGLKFAIVEASSGAMGGSASNEFVARTDAGEDLIATCASCGYAANLEKATSRIAAVVEESTFDSPEEFPTPGVRTIEDLISFTGGAAAERQIKSLVYVATIENEPRPVLALLRGDHQLHETKLGRQPGCDRSARRASRKRFANCWAPAPAALEAWAHASERNKQNLNSRSSLTTR